MDNMSWGQLKNSLEICIKCERKALQRRRETEHLVCKLRAENAKLRDEFDRLFKAFFRASHAAVIPHDFAEAFVETHHHAIRKAASL